MFSAKHTSCFFKDEPYEISCKDTISNKTETCEHNYLSLIIVTYSLLSFHSGLNYLELLLR